MRMDTNKTLSVPNSPPIRTAFCLRVEQAATCLGPTPPRVPGCLRIAEWRRQARICSSHFDVRSASSNAHEISSTICQPSFNGKPKATADIPKHCRLRLAVKRGHCFVSVARALARDRQLLDRSPLSGVSRNLDGQWNTHNRWCSSRHGQDRVGAEQGWRRITAENGAALETTFFPNAARTTN